MARKKTIPVEDTEQVQAAETLEQTARQTEESNTPAPLPGLPDEAADTTGPANNPPGPLDGPNGGGPGEESPASAGDASSEDDFPDPAEEAADTLLGDATPAPKEEQADTAQEDDSPVPAGKAAASEVPTPDTQHEQPLEKADVDVSAAGSQTPGENLPHLPDWELTDEGSPVFPPDVEEETGQEEPDEVMSVDLSAPVVPPTGTDPAPEDLDSLLEDSAVGRSSASPAAEVPPDDMPSAPPMQEKSDRQKFYELKFNRLDRNLTPEERQEWNSIYASYRGRSALTGTIIGVDPFSVQVRNPQTGAMEKETMYCAIVVPYRVRIVIPASEMWEKDKERPDFVLQNMVGATIDYIIIKVDREAGFAIGSRRLALRSQRYFFAHRPNLNAVGAHLKCRMLSVGPRRCLVECYGHDVGLTQRELRYTAIPDLRDEYHPGQELDCIVKLYEPDTGRLELSVKETESNPFDGAEQRHPVGARRLAVIGGKYGGGVFCNLPDGTVCMCNYSYQHEDSDFLVGDHVMLIVQRFDVEKQQMYGKILTKW